MSGKAKSPGAGTSVGHCGLVHPDRMVSAYLPAVLGVRQRARYGFSCYGVPGRRSNEPLSHAGPPSPLPS